MPLVMSRELSEIGEIAVGLSGLLLKTRGFSNIL